MFTGIIEALGEVTELQLREGEWRLGVRSSTLDFSDVRLGDSIAVNGACLNPRRARGSLVQANCMD